MSTMDIEHDRFVRSWVIHHRDWTLLVDRGWWVLQSGRLARDHRCTKR
jgi:hypothetical protein